MEIVELPDNPKDTMNAGDIMLELEDDDRWKLAHPTNQERVR